MGSGQSMVLETMIKHLEEFSGEWSQDEPQQIENPFNVWWPSEGTLDVPTVWRVWRVMTGEPGQLDSLWGVIHLK